VLTQPLRPRTSNGASGEPPMSSGRADDRRRGDCRSDRTLRTSPLHLAVAPKGANPRASFQQEPDRYHNVDAKSCKLD